MKCRNTATRIVAVSLIVALHFAFAPVYAAVAPAQASISGSVLSWDTQDPMTGAVVHATDPRTSASYVSGPASADGHFEIAELPPATYKLAVESQGGLYLVDSPVSLVPGQSRSVQLALNPNLAPAAEGSGLKMSILNNPVMATLVVVGAAIILGVLIDEADNDDDPTVSESQP